MTDVRPDPDQLLAQVKERDAAARRGRLRIYFGASAGVGKTYAMLTAALALRREGRDVVVGLLETHGRKETEALLHGLEILPREEIAFQDRALDEFDLDAALARRPRADSRRRARTRERPRLAASQAMAGHRRAAGHRHRRFHDTQRPAHRKPRSSSPRSSARRPRSLPAATLARKSSNTRGCTIARRSSSVVRAAVPDGRGCSAPRSVSACSRQTST